MMFNGHSSALSLLPAVLSAALTTDGHQGSTHNSATTEIFSVSRKSAATGAQASSHVAVGWSLFAVTIVLIIALAKSLVAGMVHCLRCWVLGAGVLMVLTQLVLGVSVLTWRHSQAARSLVRPILAASSRTLRLTTTTATTPPITSLTHITSSGKSSLVADTSGAPEASTPQSKPQPSPWDLDALSRVWQSHGFKGCWHVVIQGLSSAVHRATVVLVPILVMYVPVQTFFTLWSFTFAFYPTRWVALGWLVLLPTGYALSLVGEPQHTGSRRWPSMRAWFIKHIETSLTYWFGSVEVVADWDTDKEAPTDPNNKYIFGYHPHGLYPTGAGYLPLMPSFRRLIPGIDPITLTASVIYYLPAIKDLSLWLGFRQVSRRTFVRALRDTKAVVVCPGGQAELVYTYASHKTTPSVSAHARSKSGTGTYFVQPLGAGGEEGRGGVKVTGERPTCGGDSDRDMSGSEGRGGGEDMEVQQDASVVQDGDVSSDHEMNANAGVGGKGQQGARSVAASTVTTLIASGCVTGVSSITDLASSVADDSATSSDTCSTPRYMCEANVQQHSPHCGGLTHPSPPTTITTGVDTPTSNLTAATTATTMSSTMSSTISSTNSTTRDHERLASVQCISDMTSAYSNGTSCICSPVPGGHKAGEMVIYAGHKGFVRLAIEQQAALVPVLALGEVLQLRDLITWPEMQKWTYKRFGFPFPYFNVGRWGLSPLPQRTPLIYVIGRPIQPPIYTSGAVQQSDVDMFHKQFYDSLADLYQRHAHRHPAFKDAPLVMLDGHTETREGIRVNAVTKI